MQSRKNSDAPRVLCSSCNNGIDGEYLICHVCTRQFHPKKDCSGIPGSSMSKNIWTSGNLTYACDVCKTINIHQLLERFAFVEKELKTIQDQINARMHIDIASIVNVTLTQFCEKQEKRNNAIIFGVTESDTGSDDEDSNLDPIMQTLSVPYSSVDFMSRIGKRGAKPRPIKLCFHSLSEKMNCMRNAGRLKRYNEQHSSKIYIRHDRTKEEIKKDKMLLEEFRTRKDNGEEVVLRGGKIIDKSAL